MNQYIYEYKPTEDMPYRISVLVQQYRGGFYEPPHQEVLEVNVFTPAGDDVDEATRNRWDGSGEIEDMIDLALKEGNWELYA